MPTCLKVIGTCQEDEQTLVMAVEHVSSLLFGVQFHPESILSEVGYRILSNFLKVAGVMDDSVLPPSDFADEQVWTNFVKTGKNDAHDVPRSSCPNFTTSSVSNDQLINRPQDSFGLVPGLLFFERRLAIGHDASTDLQLPPAIASCDGANQDAEIHVTGQGYVAQAAQ